LLTGGCLAYWIKKRRFNRINQYGVEQFKGFGDKVIAGSIEKILWWVALSCIFVGAILVIL
jgi:hypothetical protein